MIPAESPTKRDHWIRFEGGDFKMNGFYLAHHGIKGQRWGIRRFQNEDGSLTNKGKARYLSNDTLSRATEVTKSTSETINAAKQLSQATQRISKRKESSKQPDLSTMTNKDLQEAITRMNLEHQYQQLTQKEVTKGRQYLDDILSITGSIVGITGGALSIALAINKLRGKG